MKLFCIAALGAALLVSPASALDNQIYNGVTHAEFGEILQAAGFTLKEQTTSRGDKFYLATHSESPGATFGLGAVGCEQQRCALIQMLYVDLNDGPSEKVVNAVNQQLPLARVIVDDKGQAAVVSRHLVQGGASSANMMFAVAEFLSETADYLQYRSGASARNAQPGAGSLTAALSSFKSAFAGKAEARAGAGAVAARWDALSRR